MIKKDLNKISISSKELQHEWHLIDANDQILGRIATDIAMKLMGKDKIDYTPNLATGDFVVVINSDGVKLTGNKSIQKEYFKHSGYPGGEKLIKFEEMMEKNSTEVIINAVKGMLPKNKLRDVMVKRLKVFSNDKHPFENNITKKQEFILATQKYFYGTGKRKSAIARVRLYSGNKPGGVTVNGKPLQEAIPVEIWQKSATRPLEILEISDNVSIVAKTHGGGISGQADALSLGISRALIKMDPAFRKKLKTKGLLTRDSRVKESKKYGLKRARKAQQFTKR